MLATGLEPVIPRSEVWCLLHQAIRAHMLAGCNAAYGSPFQQDMLQLTYIWHVVIFVDCHFMLGNNQAIPAHTSTSKSMQWCISPKDVPTKIHSNVKYFTIYLYPRTWDLGPRFCKCVPENVSYLVAVMINLAQSDNWGRRRPPLPGISHS